MKLRSLLWKGFILYLCADVALQTAIMLRVEQHQAAPLILSINIFVGFFPQSSTLSIVSALQVIDALTGKRKVSVFTAYYNYFKTI